MIKTTLTAAALAVTLAGCVQTPTRLTKPYMTTLQFAQNRKGWEACVPGALDLQASADDLNLKWQTFKDLPSEAQPPQAMEGILYDTQLHVSKMKAYQAFVQKECAKTPEALAAFNDATAIPDRIVAMQSRINAGAGIVVARNLLIGRR